MHDVALLSFLGWLRENGYEVCHREFSLASFFTERWTREDMPSHRELVHQYYASDTNDNLREER